MPIFDERPGDISIPSYFTKGLLLLFVTDTKKPFVIAAVFWTPSKIKNYRKCFVLAIGGLPAPAPTRQLEL
jgi:hypothetical protein